MLAICRAQPNWMPRKPKLIFHICQKLSLGLWVMLIVVIIYRFDWFKLVKNLAPSKSPPVGETFKFFLSPPYRGGFRWGAWSKIQAAHRSLPEALQPPHR